MESPRKRKVLKGFLYLFMALVLLPFWIVFVKLAKRIPTRIIRHQGDILQTPVVFYKHPETGRQIVFVAVIHIGEADYFTALQRTIDAHVNHAVLYEMIGRLTPAQRKSLTSDERRVLKEFDAGKELIEASKILLGLVYQKDGLTYRPHWINTDMAMLDLLRVFVEKKLRLFKDPNKPLSWKEDRQLIRWLLDALLRNFVPVVLVIRLISRFSSVKQGEKKIILDRRNKIAFDAISEHLRERNVVTIWGAEHLLGMEKDIHAAGFREVRREWFDAYRSRGHSFREVIGEAWEKSQKSAEATARFKE